MSEESFCSYNTYNRTHTTCFSSLGRKTRGGETWKGGYKQKTRTELVYLVITRKEDQAEYFCCPGSSCLHVYCCTSWMTSLMRKRLNPDDNENIHTGGECVWVQEWIHTSLLESASLPYFYAEQERETFYSFPCTSLFSSSDHRSDLFRVKRFLRNSVILFLILPLTSMNISRAWDMKGVWFFFFSPPPPLVNLLSKSLSFFPTTQSVSASEKTRSEAFLSRIPKKPYFHRLWENCTFFWTKRKYLRNVCGELCFNSSWIF